jgi:hypothetical protein
MSNTFGVALALYASLFFHNLVMVQPSPAPAVLLQLHALIAKEVRK